MQEASKSNFVLSNLCVYVAQDCTINVQEVIQLCTAKSISKDDYRSKTLHQHFSFNYAPSTSSISGLRRKSRNSLKSLGSSFELASNASKDNAGALKMSPLWSHSNEELQYNRTPLHSVPQNLHSPTDSSRTSSSSKSADSDCAKGSDDTWKAVLILVPLRLGGEKFNTIYTDCIRKLFCMPLCVGIIGGKPKHSMYFVGCQDDKLICLDPHYSQETIDVIMDNNFPLESYHCSNTKKLLINRMDPSCTIAFYCKTRHDLNVLKQFTRNELRPSARDRSISDHAIFFFEETVAATATEPASSLGNSDCASKCSDHTVFNQNHDEDDESTDRNDFVLLWNRIVNVNY